MLVWIVAEDGTYIDEADVQQLPEVGGRLTTDRGWQVVDLPQPDENATKLRAQVVVVKPLT